MFGTMFLVLMACGSAVLAGPSIGVRGIYLAANVCQPGVSQGMALFVEVLFTMVFVLVILGATDPKKGAGKFSGVAIGLALGLVNIVGIPWIIVP